MSQSKCLCQLCSCGRHKCALQHRPSAPCDCMTIYRNAYTTKPIIPVKSCRPNRAPVESDAPAEDKTTTRLDYIRHPYVIPHKHQKEPYAPPDAELDCLTSYRKEFTKKPSERVKRVEKVRSKTLADFDGQTTSRMAYTKWPMQPINRHGPDVYHPPAEPFMGMSSYKTAYIGTTAPVRPIMKPSSGPVESDAPLDGLTTTRASYIKHPLPCPVPHQQTEWAPNTAVLDDMTITRRDFTKKDGGRQESCRPDRNPVQTDAPFAGDTTQRRDFTAWPYSKAQPHQPDGYKPPEGAMATETTSRDAYTKKPIQLTKSLRPPARKHVAAQFEGMTTTRRDYHSWGNVERVKQAQRDEYKPMAEPFDGMATYKMAYIRHNQPRRPIMKPPSAPVESDAPTESSEYRNQFIKKPFDSCLAGVLKSGGRCGGAGGQDCYTLVETDPSGHTWYKRDDGKPQS